MSFLPSHLTLRDLTAPNTSDLRAAEIHAATLARTADGRSYAEARELLRVEILERDQPLPRILATNRELDERIRRDVVLHRVSYRQAFDAVSAEQAVLRRAGVKAAQRTSPNAQPPAPPRRAPISAAALDRAKRAGMLNTEPTSAPTAEKPAAAKVAPIAAAKPTPPVARPSRFATVTGIASRIAAKIPGTRAHASKRAESAEMAAELMREMIEGKGSASSPFTLASLVRDVTGRDSSVARDLTRFVGFCALIGTDHAEEPHAKANATAYSSRLRRGMTEALGSAGDDGPKAAA